MPTVLVVDDRAINREFLATLLGYAGLEVLGAGDGAEALETVRTHRPDLVITDILMPTMDGFEFVHRLQQEVDPELADVPIIFYTATYRLAEARDLARSCGGARVISKPAEPREILDAVAELLGVRAEARAPAAVASVAPYGALGDPLPDEARGLLELERSLLHPQAPPNDHHSRSSDGTQALSLRLASILELGLVLAAQSDPLRLLSTACRAARSILCSRYSVVAVGASHGAPRRVFVQGMSPAEEARILDGVELRAGELGALLEDGLPRRLEDLAGAGDRIGLPPGHPEIHDLLAVRVATGTHVHGWLYVADRLGGGRFTDNDEQLAVTLAALLAPVYESLVLLDELERHADRLEREIEERERAADELEESEQRFRQLAEAIREVFFLVDRASARVLYVSPAYEAIWGRDRDTIYRHPRAWAESIVDADRQAAEEAYAKISAGVEFDVQFRIVRPDGEQRWIRSRGFPIPDAAGESYRVAGLAEDITVHKEHQERIARLTRIHAVLSGINSAIIRIHDRDELLQEACRISVTEGVFGMAWIAILHPETQECEVVAHAGGDHTYLDGIRLTVSAGEPGSERPASRALREGAPVVCNDIGADPALTPIKTRLLSRGFRSIAAFPLAVEGRTVGVLNLLGVQVDLFDDEEMSLLTDLASDISFGLQSIHKQERLDHLAYYDALTGLANQTLFRDRLNQYLQGAAEHDENVAVIAFDLERFAQLNDTLGRHVGDILLCEVAQRLDSELKEKSLVARIGADSFGVVAGGLRKDTDAAAVLEHRIFGAVLGDPVAVGEHEIRLSAHAGVALFPADGRDAGTLLEKCDVALKRARSRGDRSLFYKPEITLRAAERLLLEQRMRDALANGELELHYQPRISADSGELVGFEALLRWQDPQNGLVMPGSFVPALEETGMILEVGRWARVEALTQLGRWRQAGLDPPRVAVNVSAVELSQHDFPGLVASAIDAAGALPRDLELEITESLIMDELLINGSTVRQIRDLGVLIAIDDFGTGYSSLAYLARLPADSLKIDHSFVAGMVEDPNSMAIVSAVISLARALRLRVVAEGVESVEQAKLLRLMKCDEMQGFLFSRPEPPDVIEDLLRAGARFDLP